MNAMRIKIIQLILESAIPLLGFYFWEWNLYFILLFYILDMLADEVIHYIKARDIIRVGRAQLSSSFQFLVYSGLSLLTVIFVIHLAIYFYHPELNFVNEIIRFWSYEELGIAQGYLLFPLVAFGAFQKYKVEFKRPKLYLSITLKSLFMKHIKSLLAIIIFGSMLIGLNGLVEITEQVHVIMIVLGVACYKLIIE